MITKKLVQTFLSVYLLPISFISLPQEPKAGYYKQVYDLKHFIPYDLPPCPPLIMDPQTTALYDEAMLYLRKIDEMSKKLSNVKSFIKAYSIKEALFSSAIEGIYTTLVDIFKQQLLKSKPNRNTQLVINYTSALEEALYLIQQKKLPIGCEVILGAHKTLMHRIKDNKADPGCYRKRPVYVSKLVPPPPLMLPELMDQLEHYINTDSSLPALIKAGLAHVQFETIHPFRDGNGRIGRLLIVLMLIKSGLLSKPGLYLSSYFKKHQAEYYQKLDSIRLKGDFREWVTYFLTAVKESSLDVYKRTLEIEALDKRLRDTILTEKRFDHMRQSMLNALSVFFSKPIINIGTLSSELKIPNTMATKIMCEYITLGILVEDKQEKLFAFKPYLDVLKKEY